MSLLRLPSFSPPFLLDPTGVAKSVKIGNFIGLKVLFHALIYIYGQVVLYEFKDWLFMLQV